VSKNGIRLAISAFLVVLLGLCVTGWIWTATHPLPPKAVASHVVLGIAILSGVIGLVAVWRKPALGS
jgi:hypothetical protein